MQLAVAADDLRSLQSGPSCPSALLSAQCAALRRDGVCVGFQLHPCAGCHNYLLIFGRAEASRAAMARVGLQPECFGGNLVLLYLSFVVCLAACLLLATFRAVLISFVIILHARYCASVLFKAALWAFLLASSC